MHPHNSASQNGPTKTHITWPCQLCVRIILLVVHSPSLPHINQIKSHSLLLSDSGTDRFKEGLYDNLQDLEQNPVEVVPLRIKRHPEPSTLQHVSRQNINQPSTTLSLGETAQFGSSWLKSPERNIGSEVIKVPRDNFEHAKERYIGTLGCTPNGGIYEI